MKEIITYFAPFFVIHIGVGIFFGYAAWDQKTGLPHFRMKYGILFGFLSLGVWWLIAIAMENFGALILNGPMTAAAFWTHHYNNLPNVIADRQAAIAKKQYEEESKQKAQREAEHQRQQDAALQAKLQAIRPKPQTASLSPEADHLATNLENLFKK